MAVNKERVQLLVDALRSGNFKQGRNMLRTKDDEYCCLGVACEVARLNGIGIEWVQPETGCECEYCQSRNWHFDGNNEALGARVAEWYGFPDDGFGSRDPKIGLDDGNDITMIRANDDLGWNLLQIADAVEAKYLKGGDES